MHHCSMKNSPNTLRLSLAILVGLFITIQLHAKTVTIEQVEDRWTFVIDGQVFPVKGATWGMKVNADNIDSHMEALKEMGVNSIRTWGTGAETQMLLDACHRHGIEVMMGIWMRHGRPGMEGDDNFDWVNDQQGANDQYKDALKWVEHYMNHPAVLCWGVGNEVVLNCPSEEAKVSYAKFLDKVCKAVKELDKHHPVISVSAWNLSWKYWRDYVPSLDGYGINAYGPGAAGIQKMKNELGISKPYVITEYGPMGEWDVQPDANGLKQEPQDDAKYSQILNVYKDGIVNKSECLGVYSFNYGDGWSHGSVWLNFFMKGAKRPGYWATREAFTGQEPENHIPVVTLDLPEDHWDGGKWYDVNMQITDAEGDSTHFEFHYNKREGGRIAGDVIVPLQHRYKGEQLQVKAPEVGGVLKLYCFVWDAANNLGVRFTSIVVESDGEIEASNGIYTKVPFWVYQDVGGDNHYVPSGYMGNTGHLTYQDDCTENPYEGKTCIKITYNAEDNWWGLAWQDPANDWGDAPGGFDLSDANKLVFYVRGDRFGVPVKFQVGMIGSDKKYYDTVQMDSGDNIMTTKKWKRYEISLHGRNRKRIKTGFAIFGNGAGKPYTLYIDNVHFE